MATLFVMCGLPASGKSTFIKNKANSNIVVVSRDEIRFSFIRYKPYKYFAYEDQVKRIFWEKINAALAEGKDVIADQTSLTIGSRKSLLKHVSGYDDVVLIWIDTDFETCYKRNAKRKGIEKVPPNTLKSMRDSFNTPSLNEGFSRIIRYTTINDVTSVWIQAQGVPLI